MAVQIGKLHKKQIVRDLSGNIIDWYDEVNGGWIVKGRSIVNPKRWEEEQAKIKDRQEAAKAMALGAKADKERAEKSEKVEVKEDKVSNLEKKVNDMENTLQAILKAVSKNE